MSAAARKTRPGLPLVRQMAVVLLVLAAALPVLLALAASQRSARVHEPAALRASLEALLESVHPVGRVPPKALDAAGLLALLPQCLDEPPREGLPFYDDLADQLARLDRNLAALGTGAGQRNTMLTQRHALDVPRWVRSLSRSADVCTEVSATARLLAGARGMAILEAADWRERRARAQPGEPTVRLAAGSLSQVDPWRGWPGCVWIGDDASGGARLVATGATARFGRELCARPGPHAGRTPAPAVASPTAHSHVGAPGDASWVVPKDLPVLLAELDALRQPEGRLYADYVRRLPEAANRREWAGHAVDVGFDLHLTIDPRVQAAAQRAAACYTGAAEACRQIKLPLAAVGAAEGPGARAMWEQAAARMVAVAVLDVASARILALASAHSPCYAQEHDGPFRDAGCTPLWTTPRRRPDRLLNHAVFTDDLPGSTVKPILASVFFEDGAAQDTLASALARSATDRFHDELFCLGARPGTLCDRPQRVQQRALALGWNADCDGRDMCGRADLLFGRRLTSRLDAEDTLNVPDAAPLQRGALVGRLFVDAEGTPMRLDRVDPSTAASCRDARGHWQASQCANAAVKPLVNESAGQGQARTTALGLATMLTRLTAAADGVTAQRRPHLVARLTDAQGRTVETAATRVTGSGAPGAARALAGAETIDVPPETARAVLRALAQATAPGGTAHLSCRHVFGARCAEVARRFAGKTGTPSFSFDRLTLDQARARCRARPGDEDCFERPMKLYVAAVQSRAGPPTGYDRVIAVITERNWYRADTGIPASVRARVHGGSNDVDNLATEIAMRIIDDAWVSTAGR